VDFRTVPVAQLAGQVRGGERSARELTSEALERIDTIDREVHAFVAVDAERALEQAAAVDQIVATGGDPGPLAGIPIGVKDSEDVAGYRTTHGSTLWSDSPAVRHDSVLVSRLRSAGAVVVGKTNLPEFAWTAHTTNTLFGLTRNPWRLDHGAGGSSGGSAAAVAAGMVPLATGSDGGGSIRIPSACCGLSGMKPSHGRVPSNRGDAGWLGLSTPGVLGRRVEDLAVALDATVGPEPSDLRALPRPEASWLDALVEPRVPARVGWAPTLGYAEVDAKVFDVAAQVVSVLDSLGAEVVDVGPVFDEDPLSDWLAIVKSCLLRTLAPHRDRWAEVTPVLRSLVEDAESLSALRLVEALDRCHRMNLRLVELFHDVRLLVTVTTAGTAPPNDLGGMGLVNGEVVADWVRLTYPFNMTRSPAATVCAGLTSEGLPVGVQLVGPQHGDLVVLRSAAAVEHAIAFDDVAPLGVAG
jgi:aspartyl-tRNA(Asn)/glutamyl-tRNA(Gln) amidotransferase subunit A